MKKLSIYVMLAVFVAFVASCSKNNDVNPGSDLAALEKRGKSTTKAIERPISGVIDGRAFTATLRVTEFIADSNQVFAIGELEKVKIAGKNHKALEKILESE